LKRLETQLQGTSTAVIVRAWSIWIIFIKLAGMQMQIKHFSGIHATIPISKTYLETILSQLVLASSEAL
jgi:hypothetical protein